MESMKKQLENILHRAGEMVREGHYATVSAKEGHANYVTNCDVAVQEYLMDALHALLPSARFIAEESDGITLTEEDTFCVDPIDGTLNFIHGRRASAISVALLSRREPVLGAVYNPFEDALFFARKGEGAFVNGKPVRVSRFPFESAVVAFGTSPYNPELSSKTLRILSRFMQEAADLRRVGSAALDLCDVACGRSDVYFELELSPWDHAAGGLIVREAGGVFVNPFGQMRYDVKCPVFAAAPQCAERALTLLLAGAEQG